MFCWILDMRNQRNAAFILFFNYCCSTIFMSLKNNFYLKAHKSTTLLIYFTRTLYCTRQFENFQRVKRTKRFTTKILKEGNTRLTWDCRGRSKVAAVQKNKRQQLRVEKNWKNLVINISNNNMCFQGLNFYL